MKVNDLQNQMKLLSRSKYLVRSFSSSTKVAPVSSITDIVLLGFFIIINIVEGFINTAPLNVYFMLLYHLVLRQSKSRMLYLYFYHFLRNHKIKLVFMIKIGNFK